MSNDVWTYRATTVVDSNVDVSGYEVEASDGSIGKVDEATYDTGRSYLVVDTGPWIFGKKVMLPAGVVREHRRGRADGLRRPDEGRDQARPRVRGVAGRRRVPGTARLVLRLHGRPPRAIRRTRASM